MSLPIPKTWLSPAVAFALVIGMASSAEARPALATWPPALGSDEEVAVQDEEQAAVEEVGADTEVAPKTTPKPKVTSKARAKAKVKRKSKPVAVVAPPTPPPASKAKLWSSDASWRWLGAAGLLVLTVSGAGAALAYRRAARRNAMAGQDQARRRANADAEVQRLTAENSRLAHSAAGADLRARRLDADNRDLAARAEAAEVEVRRLRFEEAIVPVKAQVAQIVYNRENVGARIETALGSEEDAEASEALSREARLEEDAKRLRRVLAILRKAGKASPAPILLQDLLNGQERDIYPAALTWTERQGLRLHAQASMGEFLVAAEGGLRGWVFSAFNARRVDFLITDEAWKPLLVIEHQGTGHWKDNWKLNDDVKRLVLKLAGVPLVETRKGEKEHELHRKLDRALLKTKLALTRTSPAARAS
jgi:cell division protein FtsL